MTEPFLTICPRSKEYLGSNISGIPLKVIRDDGVEYNPHIKFTQEEMSNGMIMNINNSGKSDSFTVSVLINYSDKVRLAKKIAWGDGTTIVERTGDWKVVHAERIDGEIWEFIEKDVSVVSMLDYFIRKAEPFYVVSRINGVGKNSLWNITANKSRIQKYDDKYSIWELTFTKYLTYTYPTFKNTATGVTKALKNYENKKKKNAQKKAKAKTKTTSKYRLQHECKASNLKYSSKKKVVTCVKLMQWILYHKKCLKNKSDIDGWYGKVTKEAVKKFQKKYKTKYNLKETGNVDNATFKAMYTV